MPSMFRRTTVDGARRAAVAASTSKNTNTATTTITATRRASRRDSSTTAETATSAGERGAWAHVRDARAVEALRRLPDDASRSVANRARERATTDSLSVCECRVETMPHFDEDEIVRADALLGRGSFFDVFEVTAVRLSPSSTTVDRPRRPCSRCQANESADERRRRRADERRTTAASTSSGRYAIKSVRRSIRRDDPSSVTKYLTAVRDSVTEAYFLASLSHPFLVRAVGLVEHRPNNNGEPDAGYAIVMERLHGTLADQYEEWRSEASRPRLASRKRARASRRVRLRLVYQLAEALAYLHSRRVAYRDLKPENVGLKRDPRDGERRVVLLDFGLARELRGEDQRQELSVAGSPRYMAPEVIRREPYGVAVDTYSLGLLLWETITARKAFEGWPFARLAAHANGTRARLDLAVKGEAGDVVTNLLRTLLDFDPDARPTTEQTATELRTALATVGGAAEAERDRALVEASARI